MGFGKAHGIKDDALDLSFHCELPRWHVLARRIGRHRLTHAGIQARLNGFEIYSPCVPRYVHPPVSVVHARLGIERMVWDFFTCHLLRL